MRTEREREAADLRANGQQQAQTIRARAEREATVIRAEANRKSEELRGQGDAEKNRILAEAFGRDPEFFSFYRSMQAYETGLKPGETRLVLSPTPSSSATSTTRRAGQRRRLRAGAARNAPAPGSAPTAAPASPPATGSAPTSPSALTDVGPGRSPRPRSCGRGHFICGVPRRDAPRHVEAAHTPSDRMRIVGIVLRC